MKIHKYIFGLFLGTLFGIIIGIKTESNKIKTRFDYQINLKPNYKIDIMDLDSNNKVEIELDSLVKFINKSEL